MRKNSIFAVLAVFSLGSFDALGDIAPTEYVGSTVIPVDISGIRMEDAKVDIVWGTPCKLTARFVLNNGTTNPTEVHLGFPMLIPKYQRGVEKSWPGFKIAFDGALSDASEVTTASLKERIPHYHEDDTWYRCRHTFQPGRTVVTIEAALPASLTYQVPYQERLFYCIQTGGKWDGTIGCEEVNVHFPAPVEPGQIVDARPSTFVIRGDVIQWRFLDFKPKGSEFDISLRYFRPDAFLILSDLRKRHAANPRDSALTVRLAKDLFVLGPMKGNLGFAPPDFAPVEFQGILSKINNPADRAFFSSSYVAGYDAFLAGLKNPEDRKVLSSSYESNKARAATITDPEIRANWARQLQRYKEDFWCLDPYGESQGELPGEIIRILNSVDYKGFRSQFPAIEEAEDAIKRLLEAEPKNAEAWNVYLANYYRIGFNAVGLFRWGNTRFYSRQITLIGRAHQECPQDAAINLWYQWCSGNGTGAGLEDLLKKNGVFDSDFPRLNYGYY